MAKLISLTVIKESTSTLDSINSAPLPVKNVPADNISVDEITLTTGMPTTGTTATSTALTALSSTANIVKGMKVEGTGIPAGAYVIAIVSATAVTLSATTTASASGVALTFKNTIVTDRSTHPAKTLYVTQLASAIVTASA